MVKTVVGVIVHCSYLGMFAQAVEVTNTVHFKPVCTITSIVSDLNLTLL